MTSYKFDNRQIEKGRGAPGNPGGRFEAVRVDGDLSDQDLIAYTEAAADAEIWTAPPLKTQFFRDTSKSVLNRNDSPDVGMGVSLSPYRGCEHGCIYCFARPTHEYLGLSAGLDFESKIFVKYDAPDLLRAELNRKSWEPEVVMMSGVTDCYQPAERRFELTRRCLAVFAEFRNPVVIVTKNHLVTRDIDILKEMAQYGCARVMLSITTLDAELAKRMEPRTSRPAARLKAVEQLAAAGVPVGVMVAPVIPGLTDHEMPDILKSAAEAGADSAAYTMVRLSHGLKDLFQGWLGEHYPLKAPRVLGLIRDVRGGKLNDTRFGTRMKGEGAYAEHMRTLFSLHRKKNGLDGPRLELSAAHFRRRPADGQMSLF